MAQERLNVEHDIQHLIEMNRVTHLLHKARFLTRHKRMLAYSHKFIINAEDLERHAQRAAHLATVAKMPENEDHKMVEDLVADFDPDGNEADRRIFYEVTGEQIIDGEFAHELSPDDEES